MRKIIIVILLLKFSIVSSQENKIKFKSFDYGVVGVYSNLQKDGPRGLCSNFELSTLYNKNIFSAYAVVGFGYNNENNKLKDLQGILEFDLLFGRELKINSDIKFEILSGAGYIVQDNTSEGKSNKAIGIPIRGKLLFSTSKKFAIGINPNLNLNKYRNLYSINLLLHFNF
jgi:hypothetical protein